MQIDFSFNKEKFSLNWKVFWLAMIPIFLMVTSRYLGIKPPLFTSPLPVRVDVFETIRPKLELKKPQSFKLQKPVSFAHSAYADSSLESLAAYVAVDLETGDVLAQKNLDKSQAIASLTKIMTAVVVLDLAKPSDVFTVSPQAAKKSPTRIGVVPGQKMTVEELLKALLLTSANDAAAVLADGVNQKYQEHIFEKAMNEKARILGLKNSHFDNPQGFDSPQNFSSVEDIAILSQFAMKNYPLILEIIQKDYEFLPQNQNHKQFDLYNWNGLLGVYPNVSGFKIGNTTQAGNTTVVVAERQGKKILVVLLGAPGVLERDLWASQLLDIGFGKTLGLTAVNVSESELREKYGTWKYFN